MFPVTSALKTALLHRFPFLHILVVGDVMLDRYLWGRAARISPEAPVPVVHLERESHSLGGAANVARNLQTLGARVELAGLVGSDEQGDLVRTECAQLGIGSQALTTVLGFPTITKTRILADNRQLLRLDEESDVCAESGASEELLAALNTRLNVESFDAIVLSDYAKGVATPAFCAALMEYAKRAQVPVYVDPKGQDYAKYRGARAIKPNRMELGEIARVLGWQETNPLLLAARLREFCAADFIALTLGSEGMAVVSSEKSRAFAAVAREVFDVSGAGDTVMATLVLALGAGLDLEHAAWLSNLAAAEVVAHLGATPIGRDELLLAIQNASKDASAAKFYEADELDIVVGAWRSRGLRVVFTNGCFDLLHAGHVRLLQECAALGDKLVVAINSDASVTRLKGPARPLMPQTERAAVLTALGCVDAVTIFDQDTPLELIEKVRPDVLVKGGDYSSAAVVGAEFVEKNGGKVEIVPLVAGKSTTALARKIEQLG